MTSISSEEVLTESVSSVTSGPLYDSDVVESTFSSETCTLDSLSHSHISRTSPLYNSSSLTDKINTSNEDGVQYDEERTPPSCIDATADEQYRTSAEKFVNRKLTLLRAKLESSTEADTNSANNAGDSSVQAIPQTNTSLKHSKEAEKTYTEACLGRLDVSECPNINRSVSATQSTTKPFTLQHERLKIESLQQTIETQIKRLAGEIDEHCQQAYTCPECRNQQHDKAEKEFVCEKLKLLTQTEFREKLDKHLYQMDALGLLGDIVGSCIRPSAPNEDVWKAMADKLAHLKKETQEK